MNDAEFNGKYPLNAKEVIQLFRAYLEMRNKYYDLVRKLKELTR